MSNEKEASAAQKARVAFGPARTLAEKPLAISDGAKSLRFLLYSAWPGALERDAFVKDSQAAVEALAKEWASGDMPAPRQEAIVRHAIVAAIEGGMFPVMREAAESFLALAVDIAQSPASSMDWLAPGWAHSTPKTKTYNAESRARAENQEWKKIIGKETESLLSCFFLTESHILHDEKHNIRRGSQSSFVFNPLVAIQKLRPQGSVLGADPVRALFEATQPVHNPNGGRFGHEAWCDRFQRNLVSYQLEGAPPSPAPVGGQSAPLLTLLLKNIQDADSGLNSKEWFKWIVDAKSTPWIQFDHKISEWSGDHPLLRLSRQMHESGGFSDAAPYKEAVETLLEMGYGPNYEFPEGIAPHANAKSATGETPNAIWAFINSSLRPELPEIVDMLLQAGGDWQARGSSSRPETAESVLAKINSRARGLAWSDKENREVCEKIFKRFVSLGADPLDTLPPRTIHEVTPGLIRDTVQARQEQQALLQSLSQSELEEALQIVAERRAQKKAEQEAASSQSARRSARL